MSESYPFAHAPAELRELVAGLGGSYEYVRLTSGETTVAVIVPFTEFQELQRAADEVDIAEAAAIKAKGGPWIPHAEAIALLELDDPELA